MSAAHDQPLTLDNPPFAVLGGEEAVRKLTQHFYDAMERLEPELTAHHRCIEPGKVDPGTRERFGLFLIGWLGGPQDYMAKHGHPRLRMRHAPFGIGPAERDAWLHHMREAIALTDPPPAVADRLQQYFDMAAEAMRNRD